MNLKLQYLKELLVDTLNEIERSERPDNVENEIWYYAARMSYIPGVHREQGRRYILKDDELKHWFYGEFRLRHGRAPTDAEWQAAAQAYGMGQSDYY